MPPHIQLKHLLSAWTAVALCSALGCGGSKPTSKTPKTSRAENAPAHDATNDGLASVIATVPGGTLGPYVGYGPNGALALYSTPSEEKKGRRWLVQRMDGEGGALGEPLDIGMGPDDVPFAVVRAVNGGYLALWVREVHQADVLEGATLGEDGSLVDTIHTMTQAGGEVVWADAFGTSKGAMVLWAEQSGDRAKLNSLMLDDRGKPKGNGAVLMHDVRAWEAVGLDDGVAVALVVANEQDPTLGSVVLLRIGGDGKAMGEPVSISRGSAQLDVGLVRTGRSLLMAWTDRSNADNLVYAAAADLNGKLMVAPRAPLPPQGDQALVALIEPSRANPNQALLVYEELPSKSKGPRELRLATLSAEAIASKQTVKLYFAPVGRPIADFGPTEDGFVLLTRSPICNDQGTCGKERVPWYIRLNSNLAIDSAGPLLVDALDREPPAVVWAPGCTSSTCMTLAVGGQDPANVVAMKLPKGSVAPGVPAERVPALTPPLPLSNRAVHVAAEPLSRIDVTTVGQTTFVGWVSHFAEGLGGAPRTPPAGVPGDPTKPMAAHLAIQRLDPSGQLRDTPTTISVRAVSAGGVALAPSNKANEVCVAWVGRDQGDPQLFLTRVDDDGKTKLQRMISRAKGDAADTAIVPYGDGWIVAWVDWRDGNGEVYVTRVNGMLVPLIREKRLTNAPGDASDVSLVVVGDEVLVAYGDSRDHPTHAMASPYVQKLRAANLERVGEEHRIATTGLHAKGLQLSRLDEGVVVSWVDRAPQESEDAARAGAHVTRLDVGSLLPLGEMSDLRATGLATPVSLRLSCDRGVCRGAMMVPASGGINLEGFSWFPNTSQVQKGRLARTGGASTADVAPVTLGDQVFFVDQNVDGDNRLRQVRVQWVQ